MAKKQTTEEVVEKFEKETKYCKILKSVTVVDGEETFALEKIYVKSLDRVEIRLCLYKDCLDRPQKLIARPVDLTYEVLVRLFSLALKEGLLEKSFIDNLNDN